MNSRLFQSIRERRGLVYAISSGTQLFDETGELMISAGADPARIGTVLRLVVRELRRLREQPVKGAELRQACDYAAGQIVLNLEGTSGRMMWAGGSVLHLGRVVAPETVIQRLRSVNACDVQATAAALFRKNKAAVSLVGPGASRKYTEIEHVLEELS